MYKVPKFPKTQLLINNTVTGETIEAKMRRIMNNKEPITDGAPIIYTERKEGVAPEFNIRADRMEIAMDALDKLSKTNTAKRNKLGLQSQEGMKAEAGQIVSEAKPVQGTNNQ